MIAADDSSKGLKSSVRSGLRARKRVVCGKPATGCSKGFMQFKGLIEEVVSGDLPHRRVADWAEGYFRA